MDMKRRQFVPETAILKVKYPRHSINPESMSFEDYISSPNISIKIDLLDGRSMMEKDFRTIAAPIEKFYIEFFDSCSVDELMNYLTNPESDFRVTSMDGTIIRLSHKDNEMIPNEIKNDTSKKPLKEYVFVKEKKSFMDRIRGFMHKKDC